MDAQESKQLFKRADRLYREERYGEALTVLDALDAAFPDTKNILMPRAMCLVHLGQLEHGRAIFERLVAQHPAEKLKKLSNLLEHAERQAQADAPLDALDAVLNVNASDLANARITASPMSVQEARKAQEAKSAAPREPSGPAWGKWAVIGTGVAVVLLILSLPLFVSSDGESTPREGPELTRVTAETIENISPEEQVRFFLVLMGVLIPIALLTLPVPIYLTLLFFGELPYESVAKNYFVLMGYMFLIYFVTGLVFGCLGVFLGAAATLGWAIAILMSVNQIFELGFARTLIFLGFTIGLVIIEAPVFTFIMRLFYFDVPVSFFLW